MTAWLTAGDVAAITGIDVVDGNDALAEATAAAVAFVERKRPDLQSGQAAGYVPTGDVRYGTILLAQRYYERRGSILGVAGYADYEGASPLLRIDPDIEQLLGIGGSRPFGFGAAPVGVEA